MAPALGTLHMILGLLRSPERYPMLRRVLGLGAVSLVPLVLGLAAVLLPTGGTVSAQSACVNRTNGNVRFVTAPSDCRHNEDFRAGPDVATVYGTDTLTLTPPSPCPAPGAPTVFSPIPGLAIAVDVPAGSNGSFYVSTDGGVRNTTSSLGYVAARVALFVDGFVTPGGGGKRLISGSGTIRQGQLTVIAIGN